MFWHLVMQKVATCISYLNLLHAMQSKSVVKITEGTGHDQAKYDTVQEVLCGLSEEYQKKDDGYGSEACNGEEDVHALTNSKESAGVKVGQ